MKVMLLILSISFFILSITPVQAAIIDCAIEACPSPKIDQEYIDKVHRENEESRRRVNATLIEEEQSQYYNRSVFRKVLGALGFDALGRLWETSATISGGDPKGMSFTLQEEYNQSESEFYIERLTDLLYVSLIAVILVWGVRKATGYKPPPPKFPYDLINLNKK